MVWRVRGTRCEIHEERFVGCECLLLAYPGDRAISQVFGERVTLFGRLLRFDRFGAFVESRVVLIGLAADESVEVFETRTRRPLAEWSHRRNLPNRDLVALPELARRIAVEPQGLRDRRLVLRPHAGVARRRCRDLGDSAHPHGVVVTPGQHRLARRRAQRGGVKTVEPDTVCRQALGDRRITRPTECRGRAEADIIDQHDQHIGRALRRPQHRDRRVGGVRVLRVIRRQADVKRRRESAGCRAAPGAIPHPTGHCSALTSWAWNVLSANPEPHCLGSRPPDYAAAPVAAGFLTQVKGHFTDTSPRCRWCRSSEPRPTRPRPARCSHSTVVVAIAPHGKCVAAMCFGACTVAPPCARHCTAR